MNDLQPEWGVVMEKTTEDEKRLLLEYLEKVRAKGENLSTQMEEKGLDGGGIKKKISRLEEIRYSMTELTDRMETEYVMSEDMKDVVSVLDYLASRSRTNSIILEGPPGVGKTQLLYHLAKESLNRGEKTSLVHIRVDSSMRARDLLYTVDEVGRLNDAQSKDDLPKQIKQEAREWMEKIQLGEVDTEDEDFVKFKKRFDTLRELSQASKDLDVSNYITLGPLGEAIMTSSQTDAKVFLILDEIEKGPEELMSGVLDIIEHLEFQMFETGKTIKGNKNNLRIAVTSNPEDSDRIPASFRRRCLYKYIDYPNDEVMAEIIGKNFGNIQEELLSYAIDTFNRIHNSEEVRKKPSVPELLAWIEVLMKDYKGEIPEGIPHKEILLKFADDLQAEIATKSSELRRSVEKRDEDAPLWVRTSLNSGEEHVVCRADLTTMRHDNDGRGKIETALINDGIEITTAIVESPRYDDEEPTIKRDFEINSPEIKSLGDGWYMVPRHMFKKDGGLDKLMESRAIATSDSNQDFTKVFESNRFFTYGNMDIDGVQRRVYRLKGQTNLVVTYDKTFGSEESVIENDDEALLGQSTLSANRDNS